MNYEGVRELVCFIYSYSFFLLFFLFIIMGGGVCHKTHVAVRGQVCGVGFLYLYMD